MLVIRDACAHDAGDIAHVHVTTWRTAYRDLVPDWYLEGLDVARRTEVWRRLLSDKANGLRTFVVESGDRIIGFASTSPSRDEDVDPQVTGEVLAIYVDPGSWGAGAGRLLMDVACTSLAGSGFRDATLWVLEGNARARGFYEIHGWQADGTVKHDDSRGFPVTEVRYRCELWHGAAS
jgi:ribosomal protein S18 acetylase RimI-like enzyme